MPGHFVSPSACYALLWRLEFTDKTRHVAACLLVRALYVEVFFMKAPQAALAPLFAGASMKGDMPHPKAFALRLQNQWRLFCPGLIKIMA